jgi:hypothetical protein
MAVEFIPVADVHATLGNIDAARQRALDRCGVPPPSPDAGYWQTVFETTAAEVLAALPAVRLTPGFVVRYRFFGQRGGDLLVRPFVARPTTDVETVRRLLDWHAAPDSVTPTDAHRPTQDVDLLYRHCAYEPTAMGVFEYWLAMQELWASQRWAHARVIASAAELRDLTAAPGWQIVHPVEVYEPAVVRSDAAARLAVLVHCPLRSFEVSLQQIEIAADRSLRYDQPVLVAAGPRGYV